MSRFYFAIVLLVSISSLVGGADLFVAPSGDDAGPGSLEQPLRTIQRAVDLLEPGDTCYVREGVYRETVAIRSSGTDDRPIRVRAYPGENPVLDGTEPIDGPWQRREKGVFATQSPFPLEQLFAGGKMLTEARWPNCEPDRVLTRDGWSPTGPQSKYGEIHSPELAATGADWNGSLAILNVAHQFWTWSRTVEGYTLGSDRLPYTITMNPFHYENRNWWDDDYFYLIGNRAALDAEGEWLLEADRTLRLIPPGGRNPAELSIRAKQRDYGITGDKLRLVEISGINFFGCTFRLTDCEDCLIEYAHLLYPSYARGVPDAEEKGKTRPCPGTMVSGRRNTIRSCAFEHCPNYGVVLQGERNVIEDSIVHDVNWPGTLRYPAVSLRGDSKIDRPANVARHNTFYHAGNAIVTCSGPDSVVEYNHVHHGGLISSDVSLIYTSMPAADGVEFRYNWVHDSLAPHLSLGLRGDDKTRGLRVHHNVIWNVAKDGIVAKGGRNRVYNNTCLANGCADICFNSGPEPDKWWQEHVKAYQHQNEDSLLINNCASAIISVRRPVQPPLPGDNSNNFTESDAGLVDPLAFDFRPRPDSPLVDAGRAIEGVTAAFEGAAPDIGAYELGGEHWLPGHRNSVWLSRTADDVVHARLSLPILEPVTLDVAQQDRVLGQLKFTPDNWQQPQSLPVATVEAGSLAFRTESWGEAVIDDIAKIAGLIDARTMFSKADIASARQLDSQPKFDYENSYTAEPIVHSQWRAYWEATPPVIDGIVRRSEWPGWDRMRTISLVSREETTGDATVSAEAYAMFDNKNLYFFIYVPGSSRQQSTTAQDDQSHVDLIVSPVIHGRLGAKVALRAMSSGRLTVPAGDQIDQVGSQAWITQIASATGTSNGGWNGELAIPLRSLGISANRPAELRFNLQLDSVAQAVKVDGPPDDLKSAGSLLLDRSVSAESVDVLEGGSFEDDGGSRWRTSSNSRVPLPDDAVTRVPGGLHGGNCIRLFSEDTEAMQQRVIKWTYYPPQKLAAPGRYCLSYRVRIPGDSLTPQGGMGSFNAYLRVQQSPSVGSNLGQSGSRLTQTGDRWIRRDAILNVPPGATPTMLSLQLHQATGTVLIDDVSLLRCED